MSMDSVGCPGVVGSGWGRSVGSFGFSGFLLPLEVFILARYYWQSGIVSTFKNECVLLLGLAIGIVLSTVKNSRRSAYVHG